MIKPPLMVFFHYEHYYKEKEIQLSRKNQKQQKLVLSNSTVYNIFLFFVTRFLKTFV